MRAVQIRLASILEYALGVFNTGLNAVSGSAPLLSQDIQWKEIRGEELLQGAKAAGRGVALALPLLLIFGGLFTAADSVFATIVNTTLRGDFR